MVRVSLQQLFVTGHAVEVGMLVGRRSLLFVTDGGLSSPFQSPSVGIILDCFANNMSVKSTRCILEVGKFAVPDMTFCADRLE